jgi:hypothetical protein
MEPRQPVNIITLIIVPLFLIHFVCRIGYGVSDNVTWNKFKNREDVISLDVTATNLVASVEYGTILTVVQL